VFTSEPRQTLTGWRYPFARRGAWLDRFPRRSPNRQLSSVDSERSCSAMTASSSSKPRIRMTSSVRSLSERRQRLTPRISPSCRHTVTVSRARSSERSSLVIAALTQLVRRGGRGAGAGRRLRTHQRTPTRTPFPTCRISVACRSAGIARISQRIRDDAATPPRPSCPWR
jgi:hypothetical protein